MTWSKEEVKLIVEDYFNMLRDELSRKPYNKAKHRQELLPRLNKRSKSSVEFKHHNISAVLVNLGQPYISGYVPYFNYQKLLEEEIINYIKEHQLTLERRFQVFAEETNISTRKKITQYKDVLDEAPKPSIVSEKEPLYRPIKINYLEKEQNNRALGELGEGFVIDFEKNRLINEGKEGLAEKIEWVSKDIGDGLGYDILSKNKNGTDRFIEVKTTKLSKETPIFLTRNELSFSAKKSKDFYLYRVFDFYESPRLFIKQGSYDQFCQLQPQTYKGFL